MKPIGIGPLLNFYNRLEKDDIYHQISGILLQNIGKLGDMSIQEAAALCYTSSATISRLAKRAGYGRFNTLKEAAKQQLAIYYQENRTIAPEQLIDRDAADVYLKTIITMLEELNRDLDRDVILQAVELIDASDAVYYFGSCDAARRFQQDLFVRGKAVEVYQLFSAEIPHLIDWKDNSIAIVENPGYPWFESNAMIRRIKDSGAKVMLITCAAGREMEEAVDLCIRLNGTKSGRDEVLYQAVMAILSLEYRKRYMDTWYYE